jgi:hypothetical protein
VLRNQTRILNPNLQLLAREMCRNMHLQVEPYLLPDSVASGEDAGLNGAEWHSLHDGYLLEMEQLADCP